MKVNRVVFARNQVIIHCKKAPFIILFVLSVVLFICAIGPLFGCYLAINEGSGIQTGHIFVFILLWALGFQMLKIVLWNSFGKEEITIHTKSIYYQADYRFFKGKIREISKENLEINYRLIDKQGIVVFSLTNEEDMIESVLKIEYNDFERIAENLELKKPEK
jgi:hypothetical protein